MQYEGAPSLSGLEQEHGPDAMRGASERVKMEEDDGPAEASTSTLRQVDIMDETDSSGMRPMPLQPLPAGYTLLALAMQFVRQAHALTPVLARRPTAHDNDQEQDEAGASSTIDLVANYRRLIDAALICCRAVVDQVEEQGGTVDMEGIKLQLRARAMLAELLVRETNATEETELHIFRGLKTCTAHPALIDLRCRFYVLQVEFSLSDGNAKFAHNAVRRYIKEVSLLLSKSNPAIVAAHNLVSWMYHFYLLGVHIAHQLLHDYPAAVAHLKDMMQLAVQQEETILVWTLKTMAARLALINQDDNLASGLMLQLAAGFQLPTTDKQMAEQQETFVPPAGLSKNEVIALMHRTTHRDPWIQDKLPRILVMQFLVVLSLWQAYQGEMQAAKATVKRVHVLLDMPDSQPGEAEGWARVDITTTLVASSSPAIPLSSPWGAVKQASSLPPSSPTPAAATSPLSASYAPSSSPEKPYLHSMPQTAPATVPLFLATLPKQILYSYTFLVSTVVQLDPCGSSPKCLLYAMAGSNSFAAKLRGSEEEALPYGLPLPTIVSALQQVTRMQAEVMLVQIELYLMRSSLEQAEVVLTSLTALVKAHNLWTDYCGEILLIRGMIYHALGDLVNAFSHYHAGLLHSDPKSGTGLVCRASLLFIKIAHGYAVTTGMPDTNDKKEDGRSISPTSPVKGAYDEADGDELDPLYRAELAVLGKFAQALIDDCQNGTPSEQMLGLILVAFTHGELVRVKAYLSAALQQSNKVNSLYAKPLILALMATTFKYTQDDQSQKMMHSAHTICRSMGSHATEKAHKWGGDKEADEAGANDRASRKRKREKNIGPDSVGIVKLGLWTGQELLESYSAEGATERIKRQTLYNAAHETVLADQISTFGQRDRVKREQ